MLACLALLKRRQGARPGGITGLSKLWRPVKKSRMATDQIALRFFEFRTLRSVPLPPHWLGGRNNVTLCQILT